MAFLLLLFSPKIRGYGGYRDMFPIFEYLNVELSAKANYLWGKYCVKGSLKEKL